MNTDLIKYVIVSLLLVEVSSCTIDRTSYVRYFNNPSSGLSDVYSSESWVYSLQYRSPELMALIEVGDSNPSKVEFEKIVENYKDLDYYLLTIKNKITVKDQSQITKYLSFSFRDQIKLLTNIEEKQADLYHYEGGLSSFGEHRCLLGFVKQEKMDNQISIERFVNDKNIQFNITQEAISKIPQYSI